jgi:hypothetical protein
MPSLAHQIAVILLAEDPFLLSLLAEKLLGKARSEALDRVDSTVQFGKAREIRQLRLDRRKARRWPVLVGILLNEHDAMGDLLILTPYRHVAQWASNACREAGPLGTQNRMMPAVLCISDDKVDSLLDEACPRLAFFAAWAMHKRYGPRAQAVVEKALRITNTLPRSLRTEQTHAIFDVLNKRLLSKLKEKPMPQRLSKIPESAFLNQWWSELQAIGESIGEARGEVRGKAEGKREDLLMIFDARGLRLSVKEKARILECTDIPTLDLWLADALRASSVKATLARAPQAANGRVQQTI